MNQQNKILELVNTPGLSCSDMTSSFKIIGNGDMQTGVKTFAEYFRNSNIAVEKKISMRNGFVAGSIVTLIVSCVAFAGITLKNRYDRFQQEKALKEQEMYIVRAMNKKVHASEQDAEQQEGRSENV